MEEERKWYSFKDILKFLSFDYNFEHCKEYPFNRGRDNVIFSWGQIIIPKYGIEEIVQNKISDISDKPITEIKMLYQIPFTVIDKHDPEKPKFGLINKNIGLGFRYDKEYTRGKVTKSIYECCFWILQNATRTNDFYIIQDGLVQDFFSYCVINNQWGLGSLKISSSPCEKF